MNEKELKTLSDEKMLGTHCKTHSLLSSLTKHDIKSEIYGSCKYLEKITNGNIFSIAYPFGHKESINEKVLNISKEFGFKFGLTMLRGINDFNYINDKNLELMRIDTKDFSNNQLRYI